MNEIRRYADLVKVDDIELLAGDTVEHATFFVDENDLHRFKFLGELSSGDVGVDIEDLTGLGLGQAGKDRYSASTDRLLERALVNPADLSYKTVLLLVQVVCGEDARGDRPSTCSKLLEGPNELQVFLEEDAAGNVQGLCIYPGRESE